MFFARLTRYGLPILLSFNQLDLLEDSSMNQVLGVSNIRFGGKVQSCDYLLDDHM